MKVDRRRFLSTTLTVAAAAALPAKGSAAPSATKSTILLWPDGPPGKPAHGPVEAIEERSADPVIRDRAITGTTRPRLDVFHPAEPNGASVLIMPGGGYRRVVIDKEGYELGRWLAARGYHCFVLFYRLPGDGWAAGPDVALSDAQRALRVIRAKAGQFGIDADRVAALGFSAGGHLCADLATRFAAQTYDALDAADDLSARPTAAAMIYPVISLSAPVAHPGSRKRLLGPQEDPALEARHSPHRNVTPDTPPCFLLHAEDDESVPVENSLEFRAALKARGIPVDTHLFAEGGHGFGLRRIAGLPVAAWPALLQTWLEKTL
jgi:acetyl esterase/lipase